MMLINVLRRNLNALAGDAYAGDLKKRVRFVADFPWNDSRKASIPKERANKCCDARFLGR